VSGGDLLAVVGSPCFSEQIRLDSHCAFSLLTPPTHVVEKLKRTSFRLIDLQ
jgi:hypothetical protein